MDYLVFLAVEPVRLGELTIALIATMVPKRLDIALWVPYFQELCAAATALLAIAFLTFHLNSWRRSPLKQIVAVTTLSELAASMFFGLIFLIPRHPWVDAGRIVGLAGYVLIIWHLIRYYQHRKTADRFDKRQALGTMATIVTFSIMLWCQNLTYKAGDAL